MCTKKQRLPLPDKLHTSPMSTILINFIHYPSLPRLNMYFYRSLCVCDNFSKGPLPRNASKGIMTINVIQKLSTKLKIITQFTVDQKCNWEISIKSSQTKVYPYFSSNYKRPSKHRYISLDSFS